MSTREDQPASPCRALVPAGPLAMVSAAPQAVVALDPMAALMGGGRLEYAVLLPGETLAEYFTRVGVPMERPLVVRLSGARIPRAMWRHTRPRPGQLIEVQAVLQGGGSGRKIARVVIGLVIAVASAYIGNVYGAGWGIAFALGANALLNALLPPIPPRLKEFRQGDTSPTYSLAGAQNRVRPYDPLPVLLGTHRIVPDLGAAQYTEFEGDDQYLYAVFNFGLDSAGFDISELKIGETAIGNFSDVRTEWSGADGKLSLVAGNVDTLAGGSLTFAAGFLTRTSSVDATALSIDIEGLLFFSGADGVEGWTALIEAEYRLLPAGSWQPFFGAGVAFATSYWSKGYVDAAMQWQQVGFDPDLFAVHVEGDPAGTLEIGGDAGGTQALVWSYKTFAQANAGNWQTPWPGYPASNVPTVQIASASTRPLRRTFQRYVPQGQYEVRVRRANAEETDSRVTSQLQWSVLRSYQPDPADYTGQRRLAVKIRASGQLQGALETVNAVGRRKTWAWNGSAWVFEETSNPAWWLVFVAKGLTVSGRRVFGLGLTDAQIDYDAVKAWGAWCEAKGLGFNAVLDQGLSNGQLLDAICAAGWGAKTLEGGRLGVVWDSDATPVTAVVAMHNIIAGSFRVVYNTEPGVDEVVCTFLNAANGYTQEQVRVPASVVAPRRSQTIELWGVTDRDQAGRAANLRYAEQLYRRKVLEWEMDAEGTISRYGEAVAFTHDMTQWGYGGRLVSVAGAVFTLDRRVPVNGTTPANTWLGVRVPGESGYRVLRVAITGSGPDNDADTVTLVDPWPGAVDLPGVSRPALDYLWLYDFKATPGYRAKIVAKRPFVRNDGTVGVRFRAVPDGPEYHGAAGGTFATVAPQSLLATAAVISGLVITEQLKPQGSTWVVELTATWNANGSYASAQVLGSVNGNPVVTLGRTADGRRRFSWVVTADEVWSVSVRPFNGAGQAGAVVTAPPYTVLGLLAPPGDVAGLTSELTTNGILLRWDEATDIDYAATELRVGATWESALLITRKSARTHLWGWQAAGAFNVLAKHLDTSGNESAIAAATVVSVSLPATPSLQAAVIANNVLLNWSDAKTTQPIRQYRIKEGASFEGATDLGSAGGDSRFETYFFSSPGAKRIWIQAEDVAGNLGAPNAVDVTVSNALGFKLRADFASAFAGAKTNAALQADGSLLCPIDTAETWATHFSSRGWANSNAQVSAGYPLYLQPNPASATYQEVFDLGSTFTAASTITATFGLQWLVGNGSAAVQLAVSNTSSTGPWTDLAAGNQVTTDIDFRWVRVTITVSGDGGTNDLASMTGLACRVSQQKLTESGTVNCVATDVGGTTYTFSEVFSSVLSIQVTPIGTADRRGVADWVVGASNPTSCKVFLWDSAGNRVTGPASVDIEGFQ